MVGLFQRHGIIGVYDPTEPSPGDDDGDSGLPLGDWLNYTDFQRNPVTAGNMAAITSIGPGGTRGTTVRVVDSGGNFTIDSKKFLHVAGAAGTADPRIDFPSIPRATGLAFYARMSITSGICWFGFDSNQTSSMGEAGIRIDAADSTPDIKFVAGVAAENPTYTSLIRAGEWYEFLIVLRSTGCHYYIRGTNQFPTWTLLFVDLVRGTAATLFAGFSNFSAVVDIAAMGIIQLASPWTTDNGSAEFTSVTTAGNSNGNGEQAFVGRADMLLTAHWTPTANSQNFTFYCRSGYASQDDSNNIKVVFNCGTRGTLNSGTIRMYRRTGGVDTELGSAQTWTSALAGVANQVSVLLNGTNIKTCGHNNDSTNTVGGQAWKHDVTESTYRYNYRAKLFWDGTPAVTWIQWSIHMPLQSMVPTVIDNDKSRLTYVKVERGQAALDISSSNYRVGMVMTQVTPSMTTVGTSAGRTLANTNINALAAAGAIYNILVCPGLNGGGYHRMTQDISLSGTPTIFNNPATDADGNVVAPGHLDREYDWWIARGGTHISFTFWMAPSFMLAFQHGIVDGPNNDHQKSITAAQIANYAALAENVLERYADVNGSKYNAQLTYWIAVYWVEGHGYGSYDENTTSFQMDNLAADWEVWKDGIRTNADLSHVELGGPYPVVSVWRESASSSSGISQYTWPVRKQSIDDNLQVFLDNITEADLDAAVLDHWVQTSVDVGSPLTYYEQLRRTSEFYHIAKLYGEISGKPVHCYEMYPQVILASVGTDYGGTDFHQWAGCWFASAHYWLLKSGAYSGYHWGIQGDGAIAYQGNQASNLLQDTRESVGAYPAGSAFPTYDAALAIQSNFKQGTALKRASSVDGMVLVLASATKTLLINQHSYSQNILLDIDGTLTEHTLSAYGFTVV